MSGKKINDGGRAFPCRLPDEYGRGDIIYGGMSLRDWFAGQAMMGLCVKYNFVMPHEIADNAYVLADAMIAAREVRP